MILGRAARAMTLFAVRLHTAQPRPVASSVVTIWVPGRYSLETRRRE